MVEEASNAVFVAESVAAIMFVLAVIGELLHVRRSAKMATLAFGIDRKPRLWALAAPFVRTMALVALAWGFSTLLVGKPKAFRPEGSVQPGKEQHLMVLLDVSPSMRLEDAGPTKKQSRKARSRDIMRSLLERIPADQYLISVVAVYNGAKPVVVDSRDPDVIDGILSNLPMHQAFVSGETRLLDGLKEGAKIAKPWNPASATIIMLSDGDTVPPQGMPEMPASVGNVLVVGVGDPMQGSFIDGRHSKQDVFTLRQIATRLRGHYHDGNQNHLPSELVAEVTTRGTVNQKEPWGRREYALLAIGLGGFCLSLLPYLLEQFGTAYLPGIRTRSISNWRRDVSQPQLKKQRYAT
jgi:Ca-activated chloride channel homolog